ncbi:MAG: hypothetical protein E7469_06115 [Ruminococcaceae bacterium]|nr:hypothetical protein [Oscillospiraceae bacterium]
MKKSFWLLLLCAVLLLPGCAEKEEAYDFAAMPWVDIAGLIDEGKIVMTDELWNELSDLDKIPMARGFDLVYTKGQLYRARPPMLRKEIGEGWVQYATVEHSYTYVGAYNWPAEDNEAENMPVGSPIYEHPDYPHAIMIYNAENNAYTYYTQWDTKDWSRDGVYKEGE